MRSRHKNIEVLLIEDDPGDVELTRKAFETSKLMINLNVINNGEKAIAYLHQEGEYHNAVRPNLILLDLNLPGMNGREILSTIKNNSRLCAIPVVVLSNSDAEQDVLNSYKLGANCYINKLINFKEFIKNIIFI